MPSTRAARRQPTGSSDAKGQTANKAPWESATATRPLGESRATASRGPSAPLTVSRRQFQPGSAYSAGTAHATRARGSKSPARTPNTRDLSTRRLSTRDFRTRDLRTRTRRPQGATTGGCGGRRADSGCRSGRGEPKSLALPGSKSHAAPAAQKPGGDRRKTPPRVPLSLCGHGEAGPNIHAKGTSATPQHTGPGTREGLGFPAPIRGA